MLSPYHGMADIWTIIYYAYIALLQYRNTPSHKDGLLPAQNLYGHPVQDTLPTSASSPQNSSRNFKMQTNKWNTLQSSKTFYNTHTHNLPDILVGSKVTIQHPITKSWDTYGTVIEVNAHCRYHVKTQNGRVFIHNRHFLQRCIPTSIPVGTCLETTIEMPTQQPPPRVRHSMCIKHTTRRLIDDPNWN